MIFTSYILTMTDPIFDPNNGQVPTSTPVQNQNEPQGIFG